MLNCVPEITQTPGCKPGESGLEAVILPTTSHGLSAPRGCGAHAFKAFLSKVVEWETPVPFPHKDQQLVRYLPTKPAQESTEETSAMQGNKTSENNCTKRKERTASSCLNHPIPLAESKNELPSSKESPSLGNREVGEAQRERPASPAVQDTVRGPTSVSPLPEAQSRDAQRHKEQ